jgi:hypothetical protein
MALMLLLAGCSLSGELPEFDLEQSARDILPESDATSSDLDPTSTRYLGDAGQFTVYLAKGTDTPNLVCIAAYENEVQHSMSCGGGSAMGLEMPDGTLLEVGGFAFPDRDVGDRERTKLSDSVVVIAPY